MNMWKLLMVFSIIGIVFFAAWWAKDGYQFYTCSKSELWMDGWFPQWKLENGLKDYKVYLENESI